MNQKQRPKKRKRGATAAVLCFVAAIAIVGTYTFKDYKETKQMEELAQAQEQLEAQAEAEGQSEKANADDIVNEAVAEEDLSNASDDESVNGDGTEDGTSRGDSETDTVRSTDGNIADSQSLETGSSNAKAQNISFKSSDKLLWPISGSICMNYSMDKTVYFQTLDQYKYNPALIISGAEGDQVISSAPGIVKSIDVTAQTGTTINVDIGNGYELFYGQLKEVPVKTGDYVEAKTVLGYVSEPTKYYSVEGANVYFEMRKDGQPVDPMDYMVE